jgi:hypothetical protein
VETRNHLRDAYERLPEAAKDEVFRLLRDVLVWRGWDRDGKGVSNSAPLVDLIAEVFAGNGVEIEEYT